MGNFLIVRYLTTIPPQWAKNIRILHILYRWRDKAIDPTAGYRNRLKYRQFSINEFWFYSNFIPSLKNKIALKCDTSLLSAGFGHYLAR